MRYVCHRIEKNYESDIIMRKSIENKFNELEAAKKQNATLSRLVILFSFLTILAVLYWGWNVTNAAYNKILVIDRSGEYLKVITENREKLFVSLVKTTCSQLTHYANSFDRNNIEDNQAKALFLCSKESLTPVFALYRDEKSYHEAMERGVIYRTEIEDVSHIGDQEPFQVKFTSVLSIIDNNGITKFRIYSEGELVKTTPTYPNNNTGLFFKSYRQAIRNIE